MRHCHRMPFFFFNDTATTEIYTLSLHDALPISTDLQSRSPQRRCGKEFRQVSNPLCLSLPFVRSNHHGSGAPFAGDSLRRSEEHTSELQSPDHLVCRLLLEKKKTTCHEYSTATL